MSDDFYIKLTLAVYRVTELFPNDEPLRNNIRDLANEILVSLICNNYKDRSNNIKIIKSYFDLAENQNWVDSRNFSVLRKEYDKIQGLINTGKTVEKSLLEPAIYKKPPKNRKEKILEILKDKKRIKVKELTKDFPQISKRTIIRDLEELYQAGVVARVGNARASCYNIKS